MCGRQPGEQIRALYRRDGDEFEGVGIGVERGARHEEALRISSAGPAPHLPPSQYIMHPGVRMDSEINKTSIRFGGLGIRPIPWTARVARRQAGPAAPWDLPEKPFHHRRTGHASRKISIAQYLAGQAVPSRPAPREGPEVREDHLWATAGHCRAPANNMNGREWTAHSRKQATVP